MKISETGIKLIKQFEGLRLQAYKALSTEQYFTIGYGHYGADVYKGMTITEEQADKFLRNDINKFEDAVNKYTNKYNFTQGQFDALVSFAFNCGIGNLNKLVDNGNRTLEQIADNLVKYNKAGGHVLEGLVRRRQEELKLFNMDYNLDTSKKIGLALGKYKVTASSLKIRKNIGTDSEQVGILQNGEIIELQSIYNYKNQIWGKIATNKYICMIYDNNKQYVTLYVPVDVQTYSYKTDQDIYVSKNFKVKEFHCKDMSDKILIDTKLIYYLQCIRDYFDKPVLINSAYRTESYNIKVKGAKNSYHLKGRAADINIKGVSPKEIAAYAESIGILGIGEYPTFVHVDTRDNKSFWYGSNQVKINTFIK